MLLHQLRFENDYPVLGQPGYAAEGESVGGYGRIELYVSGKLFHTLLIHHNGDLIVVSCAYEINSPSEQQRENKLYPRRDRLRRKPKRKVAR
jgi:hypothetical protein